MFEINPVRNKISDISERTSALRGIFDFDNKVERLEEVSADWSSRMYGMIRKKRKH